MQVCAKRAPSEHHRGTLESSANQCIMNPGRWEQAGPPSKQVQHAPGSATGLTCVSCGQDAHGIAAVDALAHKEGLIIQLGDGVVAPQHLGWGEGARDIQ